MSKKVRFAVVGIGFIGKKHAELIEQHPDAELVAIIDVDNQKSSLFKVPFFDSLEAFIKSNIETDIVNICSPNYLHTPHSLSCLDKGFHVICEKPLALTHEECAILKEKEKSSNKKIICVLQNRYSPPIKWLKEIVESQSLGKIYQIQVNCFWNRDDRYYFPNGIKHPWKGTKKYDGGVLFTQFSHFVDILTWCFGKVENLAHKYSNFTHQGKTDFEDTGCVLFKTIDGALGNFNYSTAVWDKNLESSMTIIGEKGSVKIGGQYMDKVEVCHIDNYQIPTLAPSAPPNDYGHFKGSAQNHQFVIQNAIDFLLHDKKIDVGLTEGILSVENIIELAR